MLRTASNAASASSTSLSRSMSLHSNRGHCRLEFKRRLHHRVDALIVVDSGRGGDCLERRHERRLHLVTLDVPTEQGRLSLRLGLRLVDELELMLAIVCDE